MANRITTQNRVLGGMEGPSSSSNRANVGQMNGRTVQQGSSNAIASRLQMFEQVSSGPKTDTVRRPVIGRGGTRPETPSAKVTTPPPSARRIAHVTPQSGPTTPQSTPTTPHSPPPSSTPVSRPPNRTPDAPRTETPSTTGPITTTTTRVDTPTTTPTTGGSGRPSPAALEKLRQAITTLDMSQPHANALLRFAEKNPPNITAAFIKSAATTNAMIGKPVTEKGKELATLEGQLGKATERKAMLTERAEAVKAKIGSLNSDIEAKKSEMNSKIQLAEQKYQKTDYKRYSAEYERLHSEYQASYSKYTAEFDRVQEIAGKITQAFAEVSREIPRLTSAIANAKEELAELKTQASSQKLMLGTLTAQSLEVASRANDPAVIAQGLGVVSKQAVTSGFGGYDARTTLQMARNALNVGSRIGGDYFTRMENYYSAGKQSLPDPLKSTATTGRLNATGTNYTRELAKAMVGSDGSLDFNRDTVKSLLDNLHFHPDNLFNPLNAVVDRVEKFRTLASDVNTVLRGVGNPTTPAGAAIVRSTLGMAPNARLDANSARAAVVSAMMTPFAQGQVGSCFATGPCRKVFETNPRQVANDLVGIVNTGCLTKPGMDPLPVVTRIGDTSNQNALLRSWEYTVTTAGARIENANEMTHFQDALFGNYGSQSGQRNFTLRYLESRLPGTWATNEATMKQAIASSFTFRYDPTESRGGASDGNSDRGAFIMQHKSSRGTTDITTPEQFSQALTQTLTQALRATGTTATVIQQLVGSANFQQALGPAYRSDTQQAWPWELEGGGRSNDVIKVLTQSAVHKHAITSSPSTPDQLLTKFVTALKDKTESFVSLSAEGIHSMNALPNHPSLSTLKSGSDVAANVQSSLIDKGRNLARTPVGAERAAEIFSQAMGQFATSTELTSAMSHLPTANMTPAQLKSHIQLHARGATDDQVASLLLKSLDFPQFVITDTNWGDASGQVYMTVAPDPTTGTARLWKQDGFTGDVSTVPANWLNASWAFLA